MNSIGLNNSFVKNININNFDNTDISNLKRQASLKRQEFLKKQESCIKKDSFVNNKNAQNKVDKNSKLYKVCQDFESIFIKQMLNVMRKTVHKTGLMQGGMAEEIFEDMLYDKYALKMAKTAQFGLTDILYKQLKLEE